MSRETVLPRSLKQTTRRGASKFLCLRAVGEHVPKLVFLATETTTTGGAWIRLAVYFEVGAIASCEPRRQEISKINDVTYLRSHCRFHDVLHTKQWKRAFLGNFDSRRPGADPSIRLFV